MTQDILGSHPLRYGWVDEYPLASTKYNGDYSEDECCEMCECTS